MWRISFVGIDTQWWSLGTRPTESALAIGATLGRPRIAELSHVVPIEQSQQLVRLEAEIVNFGDRLHLGHGNAKQHCHVMASV